MTTEIVPINEIVKYSIVRVFIEKTWNVARTQYSLNSLYNYTECINIAIDYKNSSIEINEKTFMFIGGHHEYVYKRIGGKIYGSCLFQFIKFIKTSIEADSPFHAATFHTLKGFLNG